MFIAALFTVAKTWKQLNYPSLDDWIKKMWYIYTMEYYSAIRKDVILPYMTTWMDLENIVLSEISQAEKVKNHVFSLLWDMKATNEQTRKTKTHRHRQQYDGYQRERTTLKVRGDKYMNGRRFDFGWCATMQYTGNIS